MQQHRNCHRSYSTRYRCNGFTDGKYGIIIHIPAKFIVLIPVNTNVNDNRTLFYIICVYHLRLTDGNNQNIGPFADLLQILCSRMCDRNGFPTILLLPKITHSLPSISILLLFKSSIIPAGVQEIKPFCPIQSAPTLWG